MRILTTTQRTPEWYAARIGKLTASRACDMLATIKSGEAAARRDLRMQIVCERLTGTSQEDVFVNAAMQRGIDKEADAFAAYEAQTGNLVNTVGFLAHDELPTGCSPDGEVGGFAGLIELKCPKSATHLASLRTNTIPKDYQAQITHALWITGAAWCDWVSFDDRFADPLRLVIVRLTRADVDIAAYERIVRAFLNEVDRDVEEIAALCRAQETVSV